jgi:CSLREA domain-containing protein
MSAFLQRFNLVTLAFFFATTANAENFLVNSTVDPGDGTCDTSCTLRDAIIAANASPGQDAIDFSGIVLPTDTVPITIHLFNGLPPIVDSVIMDAAITETRVLPGNPVKRPGVELDLSVAAPVIGTFGIPFFPNGLSLIGPEASESVIRGFIINGVNRALPELCALAFFNPDSVVPATPALENCSIAIAIFGADGVLVAGNYLNLDAAGEVLAGNGVTGVSLLDTSDSVIGGDSADDRNVMTAKDFEVGDDNGGYNMIQPWLLGWSAPAFGTPKKFNNNQITGNYLGVSAAGVALNPIARGIYLRNLNTPDSPFGPIGWGEQCADQTFDPCEMKGNVIERNTLTNRGGHSTFALFGDQQNTVLSENTTFNTADFQGHVEIFFESTGFPVNMLVSNNRFGVDVSDTASTGLSAVGIQVGDGDGIRIENNIITGSFFDGVVLGRFNDVGLEPAVNVTISQNSIFDNCISGDPLCKGIGFYPPNATSNDYLDPDSGPNHLQNFPVLLDIVPGMGNGAETLITELDSAPNQVYLIEFFSNSALDDSGRAEGERFLGQKTVTTDNDGHVEFNFIYNQQSDGALASDGDITFITATATRKHCEPKEPSCLYGSTSEFSQACEWDTSVNSIINCTD